ncbi:ER degradation-enhancing alpha-mannosidase-like protein 2 [Paramacrobiotus metropolitanus]|uniref:ER degradation-enhancing alpha-mannosidase-like protein 2 n=1 Tax=Paramacrobiotus metropolitanus TaxID=2943436 RepID=UPI0024463F1E|nr:ER degradation-enhancing alpha-mannosidase-like protein 2 [Paramacrobiotus metropolitanus]
MKLLLNTVSVFHVFVCVSSFVQFDRGKREKYRDKVSRMFYHAYDAYLNNAFPLDELRPLTCDGTDTWGSYSLTLIDALSTLAVMGNFSEFRRVASHLAASLHFDKDVNVSVFETNIRVVGGLLSAHLLARRAGIDVEPGWPCSGPLLRLAEDAAQRILPAFRTVTGMPYGTVNLRKGVPSNETPVTCTAGVGTFILEFGTLSRLTGDPLFEQVALKALRSLWYSRTKFGLVGNHINVQTGHWTALDAGIGAGVDSYYEYLAKGASAFQNTELMAMFVESAETIHKHLNRDDWYFWVSSFTAHITMAMFQSLEAFWPGVMATTGDASPAYRSIMHYFNIWRHYGATPEFYEIMKGHPFHGREGYPLRPELVESIYHLYQVTKDPMLLHMGAQIYESIEKIARVPCGYATIKDVRTHRLENRMESFFLAETTKYLYLLFDEENFIHYDNGVAEIHRGAYGECVVSSGNFVFNTEAHPLDISGIQCCSTDKKEVDDYVSRMQSSMDILFILGLTKDAERLHRPVKNQESLPVDSPPEISDYSYAQNTSNGELSVVGLCSLYDYCQCDIALSEYFRVCSSNFIDFIFLFNKSPARNCLNSPVALVSANQTTSFHVSNLFIPHGDPSMLGCGVDDEYDLLSYGEINPRS